MRRLICRLHAGIAVDCLWLARRDLRWALGAAACLALMIARKVAHTFTSFVARAGGLDHALAWAVESRSWRPLAALTLHDPVQCRLGGMYAWRLRAAMMERYPRQTEPVRASSNLLTQDMEAGTRTPRTDETASRPGASTQPDNGDELELARLWPRTAREDPSGTGAEVRSTLRYRVRVGSTGPTSVCGPGAVVSRTVRGVAPEMRAWPW